MPIKLNCCLFSFLPRFRSEHDFGGTGGQRVLLLLLSWYWKFVFVQHSHCQDSLRGLANPLFRLPFHFEVKASGLCQSDSQRDMFFMPILLLTLSLDLMILLFPLIHPPPLLVIFFYFVSQKRTMVTSSAQSSSALLSHPKSLTLSISWQSPMLFFLSSVSTDC